MTNTELSWLLNQIEKKPGENEWLEFKLNFHSGEELGETLSGLANGASLHNQPFGYLIFGIDDKTRAIIGTDFYPKTHKIKNDELENWLLQRLNPRPDFRIYEIIYSGARIVVFEIPAAADRPLTFLHDAYIRIGSINRKLHDFPEKERKIWQKNETGIFEKEIARILSDGPEITSLLDTFVYFDLLKIPYPESNKSVIERFMSEGFVTPLADGKIGITNLGAILFAKDLSEFEKLQFKGVRVSLYNGTNRLETLKDRTFPKGYASVFKTIIDFVNDQIPQKEIIEDGLRSELRRFSPLIIRELTANAITHQDFSVSGGPLIEIFADRIEFTNPGIPVIRTLRFIDEYSARNEKLADILRRLGICEGKGTGIDKVVDLCESSVLPPPYFLAQEKHTKITLYAPVAFNEMNKNDKLRACYQHCCLKYISNSFMTNQSLRERFRIPVKNAAVISRIIKETITEGLIKELDDKNRSRKFTKYIPYWA